MEEDPPIEIIGTPNIKRLLAILARIMERQDRERAEQKPAA